MTRLVVCLFMTLLACANADTKLCAASSSLSSETSYHSYPSEIYDSRCVNKACGVGELKDNPTKPCFSVEKNADNFNHSCTIAPSATCPIRNEHLAVGLRSQLAWIKTSPLCNLRNALPNKKRPETLNNDVNIIVFGGSVTAGVSTQGCCDQDVCSKDKYYCINDYCNWVKYMGRWFTTFGPNVRTYNLAHAGYNSDTYKDKIVEKLNLIRPNFMFKKSDVVFLDLSVNDANTFESTPTKMLILERGLEALIRRIHWLSEPASMPTIVILEMWMGGTTAEKLYPADTGYTLTYERIARHYNVTLWSYRDMVRELHNRHSESNLVSYLSYSNNYGPSSGHPPWHVHLFYADFVTALIQHQLAKCDDSNTAVSYPVVKSPQELPVPLVAHKFLHCDPDQPPLLSITSPQVAQLRSIAGASSPLPDLGTSPHDMMVSPTVPAYFSTPASAWNVIEDKVGRPGFIHEFADGDQASAVLTFHLNVTHAQLAAHGGAKLLQILYLRSYANAGKVQVLLCGKELRDGRYEPVTLDALWGDYKTFKFSLPEVYSIDLDTSNCNGMEGDKHVPIQLVHNYDPHAQGEEKAARGKQKFKLVDIKVCYSSKKRN